jgi:hypothetical protein
MIRADHQCVAEMLARIDGFAAKYVGDGVLTYFGYPLAREDAERAVRTGPALVEATASCASSGRSGCASPSRRAWSLISSAPGRPRNAGSWARRQTRRRVCRASPRSIQSSPTAFLAAGRRDMRHNTRTPHFIRRPAHYKFEPLPITRVEPQRTQYPEGTCFREAMHDRFSKQCSGEVAQA